MSQPSDPLRRLPPRPAQSDLLPQSASFPHPRAAQPISMRPARPTDSSLFDQYEQALAQSPAPQAPAPSPTRSQPGTTRPTLSLRGIDFRYPTSATAISVPGFDLFPGELTYLGGASGSGKSTLMRIMALDLLPDRGDVWIMQARIADLNERDQAELRGGSIVYIPQNHLGLLQMSPVENIQRFLYDFDGVPWEAAQAAAINALRLVKLPENCFTRSVVELSGGQQARVAIAKVIATQRPICLCDEILPALDDQSRTEIVHLYQKLAHAGYTVAVIAHQQELKPSFDRIIEMRDGRIISDVRNQRAQP